MEAWISTWKARVECVSESVRCTVVAMGDRPGSRMRTWRQPGRSDRFLRATDAVKNCTRTVWYSILMA
jgi:hypothetical protein